MNPEGLVTAGIPIFRAPLVTNGRAKDFSPLQGWGVFCSLSRLEVARSSVVIVCSGMLQDLQGTTRRRLVARAGFENARVLEVGCGSGRVTAMYADVPLLTIGLEPDFGQVEDAARSVPVAHFVRASGMDLPFGRPVFGVVLFTLSLHHHRDPLAALRQSERSLAPQGRILVLEPAPQSQIQQLCRVFEDEDDRLEAVERVLHTSGLPVLSREEFQTEWIFDDFEEVADYAFSYYDHPADPDKRRAMRDFLGPRAEQRPLTLTDTLRLTCLAGRD